LAEEKKNQSPHTHTPFRNRIRFSFVFFLFILFVCFFLEIALPPLVSVRFVWGRQNGGAGETKETNKATKKKQLDSECL